MNSLLDLALTTRSSADMSDCDKLDRLVSIVAQALTDSSELSSALVAIDRALDAAGIAPADCTVPCVGGTVKRVRALVQEFADFRAMACRDVQRLDREREMAQADNIALSQALANYTTATVVTNWGYQETVDIGAPARWALSKPSPGAALVHELTALRTYMDFLHEDESGYYRGIDIRALALAGQDAEWQRLYDAVCAARSAPFEVQS